MTLQSTRRELEEKGYSKAEVEILRTLTKLETNQEIIIDNYVKHTEFAPIRNLVYGLVAIILTAVITGIVTLVIP